MRDQVLAPGLPRPALCGPSAAKCLDPFDQKGTSIEIFFMFLVKTLKHDFGLGSFWFLLMRDQVLAPGLPRPALRGPTAAKCLDPFDQKGTSIELFLCFW